MSINQNSYMDDVPVKISEKYVPPPKVVLPDNVLRRLHKFSAEWYLADASLEFDFSLERNVIRKIVEWKSVRDNERGSRCERIRLGEVERLRLLEEKQKLLLTSVSYPNAEDLSSEADDDDDASSQKKEHKAGVFAVNLSLSAVLPQFSPTQQRFDTILTPTIVPDACYSSGSQQQYVIDYSLNKSNTIVTTSAPTTNSTAVTDQKINYSDFENDTSSPFDNVELKTINDLDVLAEVLNLNINCNSSDDSKHSKSEDKDGNGSASAVVFVNNDKFVTGCSCHGTVSSPLPFDNDHSNNIFAEKSNVAPQGLYTHNNMINFQQPNATLNSNSNNLCSGFINTVSVSANIPFQQQINVENINDGMYEIKNDYEYYSNPESKKYLLNSFKHQQQQEEQQQGFSISNAHSTMKQNTFSPDYSENDPYSFHLQSLQKLLEIQSGTHSSSKSKSVPDILKELNDEITDSEERRRKARNSSQTLLDQDRQITSTVSKTQYRLSDETEQKNIAFDQQKEKVDNIFMKLSPSSQLLAKNISLMGFPLDLVSRIAEKFGSDDKKIVEHLIPLSELLDLGFEESKVSEALLKFDNNKEQALDFLIS